MSIPDNIRGIGQRVVHDCKYMIKRHTKLYINSSHSIAAARKPKAKYGLHEPTSYLHSILKNDVQLQKIYTTIDICTGSHIALTSPVRMVVILFFQWKGSRKAKWRLVTLFPHQVS
jgi:hypothetical protein